MVPIMQLVTLGVFILLAYSIYQEVKTADAKKRKQLAKQYTGIAIGCAAIFLLLEYPLRPQVDAFYQQLVRIEHPGLNKLTSNVSPEVFGNSTDLQRQWRVINK